MLYYLFDFLDREYDLIGAGVFQYISFRAGMAVLVSLLITITFGKSLITMLRKKQVGETIRDLGLEGQMQKKGTPTMGGLIIIAAIVIPTLLFAKLENIYVILLLVTTLVLGGIGFLDDYIKVFKKNKEGLAGKFKVVGQVSVGLIVGATLFFSDDVVVREFNKTPVEIQQEGEEQIVSYTDSKSTTTTIPFVKNNELDYSKLNPTENELITAGIYILIVIFFVTAISNGANITDGIDGLAAGTSAIIGLTLAILAYISGNAIFSDYLNVMFIPRSGNLLYGFCGCLCRLSLVQLIPCPGIYGRYRESFPRRNYCCIGPGTSKRTSDSGVVRNLRDRKPLCDYTGELFQIH